MCREDKESERYRSVALRQNWRHYHMQKVTYGLFALPTCSSSSSNQCVRYRYVPDHCELPIFYFLLCNSCKWLCAVDVPVLCTVLLLSRREKEVATPRIQEDSSSHIHVLFSSYLAFNHRDTSFAGQCNPSKEGSDALQATVLFATDRHRRTLKVTTSAAWIWLKPFISRAFKLILS